MAAEEAHHLSHDRHEEEREDERLMLVEELLGVICGPELDRVKEKLDVNITAKRIVEFAEQNGCGRFVLQLARHIFGLFLATLDAKAGEAEFHLSTSNLRDRVTYVLRSRSVQSQQILDREKVFDPIVTPNDRMLRLAQEFLDTI